ncbi:MAG TPA: DUF1778 domain-containing protein [Methylomirabilota bacterium]|nr:DUF1778 domain-containing protein [Methylomirabilota bacterium]
MRMAVTKGLPSKITAKRAPKSETLQIRLTAEDAALLDLAARMLGTSKSSLLREYGIAAARTLLEEERVLKWSDDAFDAALSHLKEESRANEALSEVLAKRPIWDEA